MKRSNLKISLLLVLLNTLAVNSLHAGPEDGRLDIYWIDVLGGAATLIVTPAGESILVDTGNPKQRDVDRIVDCLTRIAGCSHLDNLLISHYDRDHYGGAPMLSREVKIRNLYDNGRFEGMRNDPGEDYWNLKSERKFILDPGDTVPLEQASGSAHVKLKCLATRMTFIDPVRSMTRSPQDCTASPQKSEDRSENANSMVMVLEFGAFRFYNATDLTWNLEARLVCPYNLVGRIDVYQTTHHGLDRSNNPWVLQAIQPTVAIMNNGPTKGCQPQMFAALKSTPSIEAIYQAHRNQRPDGDVNNTEPQYIANTEKGSSGNIIKLSVAPDSRSYTVSIPATGHTQIFRTREKQ